MVKYNIAFDCLLSAEIDDKVIDPYAVMNRLEEELRKDIEEDGFFKVENLKVRIIKSKK